MKLIKANEAFNLKGRDVLTVKSIGDYKVELEKQNHTVFLLAYDCVCESTNFSINGTFALALNNNLAIRKNSLKSVGLIIETLGFNNLQNKMALMQELDIPGHFSYIDNCSNTNLIDPSRNGDPCVNYLYIPKNINQTFHTHPSVRIGIVLSGAGICSLQSDEIPLNQGDTFILDRHELHRFYTKENHLSVMVFHPDSDSGPTDDSNPMKSRTYIK